MFLPSAALLLGVQLVLVADAVPRLDYEATCRAAQPLSAQDKTPYQNCVNDETRARSELERQWGQLPDAAKGRCIRESTIGGSPSYVELLTCLQLAQQTNMDALPSAAPPEPVTPGRVLEGAQPR